MKLMVLVWPRCLTTPLFSAVCLFVIACISLVHAQQAKWPGCIVPATTAAGASSEAPSQLEVPASALGCSFIVASKASGAAAGRVVQLAGESRISGIYNEGIRRPPAVQLTTAAEDAGFAAQQQTALLLPADGTLVLQDLLLADITLADLAKYPDQALRPTAQHIPAGVTLHMTDVRILVSAAQLQQYIAALSGTPETVSWTDNTTFLHLRSFSAAATNGSAGLEARHVTLLAQAAATVASELESGLGSNSSTEHATAAVDSSSRSGTGASADADATGIQTVTDSYILSANNATFVTLLQQLAGQQQSDQPLLIFITSNVTSALGDPRWPAGGVNITRPTIWIGSSSTNTSVDFHMDVGQFVLEGSKANVTLVNLVLENLAYGDEVSARDAEGKSLIRSHLIWAFRYRRSEPRLVLWDCVMVLPEQLQIDSFAYWADAFNSDLDFWKNQTAFMRNALGITEETYTRGHLPGDYIVQIYKKDQRMTNVTYTVRPYVAPPLPLVINPSIHSDLVTYRADPAVGPVHSREDVAVTLWNMRRNGCGQRGLILLPTPDANNTVHWGPAALDFRQQQERSDATAADSPDSSSSGTAAEVQPLRASQMPDQQLITPNSTTAAAGSNDSLANVWPAPGGELVECPVQFRGVSKTDQPNTEIDLGFVRGLFRLDGSGQSDQAGALQVQGSSPATAAAVAAGGGPRGPILQFSQLIFKSLPQGESYGGDAAAAAAGGAESPGHSSAATAAAAAPAGSASWSSIPAEAFTHLLWFVSRDVTKEDEISVTNVTLVVPPAEAAQLQTAAAAAMAAAGGSSETAVLSMVYPSASGPLAVVYRSLSITQNPAVVAAAYNTFFVGRRRVSRRLLQSPPAAAAASGTMLCVGNMKGSGITARNLCLLAQDASYPLPPGYRWGSADGSSAKQHWPGWKIALVVVLTAVPCLLLLWLAGRWYNRRKQQRNQSTSQKAILPVLVSPSGSGDGGAAAGDGDVDHSSKDVSTPAAIAAAAAVIPAVAAAGSEATASSDTLKVYAVATLASEVEDCYGSTTSNTGSEAECICNKVCGAAAELNAAAAAAAACVDIEGAEKAACAVGMGEQLGRLAALHRSMLGHEEEIGPLPVCDQTRGALLPAGGQQQLQHLLCAQSPVAPQLEGSRSLQQQQPQMLARRSLEQQQQLSGQWSFEQQQQDHQMMRLSQAITQVSLEVHMRRLGQTPSGSTASGANSAAGSQLGSSTDNALPPSGAIVYSAPRGPRRGNQPRGPRRFASAITAVPRDEMRRRVKRMSIDEMKVFVAEQPDWAELEQLYKEGLLRSGVSVTPPRSTSRTRTPTPSSSSSSLSVLVQQQSQQLQLHEVIGTGTFGVVYRATWRGIQSAVKVMQLPADAELTAGGPGAGLPLRNIGGGGAAGSRQEQMAVMETALGSSLSHPNIVQVYTYLLRPLGYSHGRCSSDGSTIAAAPFGGQSSDNSLADELAANSLMRHSPRLQRMSGSSCSSAVSGYELQLVMEYCPLGSLRAAIDGCLLEDRFTGRPQYLTVLSLALGVARAMHHMHSEGVLHGDLKAGNVLLKNEIVTRTVSNFGGWPASQSEAAPASEVLVSKVADFGLACRISDQDTHISGVHRGTLSHMSPELLVHGHASRASDVYAMGILLWEMVTGEKAFAGVAKPMLGAAVVRDRARPEWPSSSGHWNPLALTAAAMSAEAGKAPPSMTDVQPPIGYRRLTEACWAHEAQDRPTFGEIVSTLETLLAQEQQQQAAWAAFAQQQQQQQLAPTGAAAAAAPPAGSRKQRTVTFCDPPVSGSIYTGSSGMVVAENDCNPAPDSRKTCQPGNSSSSREPRYTRAAARAAATAAVAAVLGLEGYKEVSQSNGHTSPYPAAAVAAGSGIELSQNAWMAAVPNSNSTGQPIAANSSSSKVQSAGVGTVAAVMRADDDMQGLRDDVRVQQQPTYHAMLPASVGGLSASEGRESCGIQQLSATVYADGVPAAAPVSQSIAVATYGASSRFGFGAGPGSPFGSAAQSPFGTVAAGPFAAAAAGADPSNAAAHSVSGAAAAAGRFNTAAVSPFGSAAQSPFGASAAGQFATPAVVAGPPDAAVYCPVGAAAAQSSFGAVAAAAQSLSGAAPADLPRPAAAPAANPFGSAAQSLAGAAHGVPLVSSVAAAAAVSPFGAAAYSPFDQLKDQSWG